jgi:hypothetical protein
VSTFSLPATATSLTVAVSSFTATDNVGVSGYLITESATPPSASAIGWSITVPSSYTFSASGPMTAYAWARDAAGNVSASRSASVTNTRILKFFSQSTNPADLIGGFDLTVTLPAGSAIPTDTSGVPLSSAVFLSGQLAEGSSYSPILSYDSVLRKLTVNYASANSYQLGEFITILVTVPNGYVPNPADITYLFKAYAPFTGIQMPTVTATATYK